MDSYLERRLRLNTEPEYKSLYRWAINEIDNQGQQVGRDQIPWRWTLNFTATSCVYADSVELKRPFRLDDVVEPSKVTKQQVIFAQLRPGNTRDDEIYARRTTFRMFGTDRAIKEFQLEIHPMSDLAEAEICTAWGSVSYTDENDFREETFEDLVTFYLYVKPETFDRYRQMISDGAIDEMHFSVGSVAGFYSEWSPSISTNDVKVLTHGEAQKIEIPPDYDVEPPRLGDVGDAALYINRRIEFAKRAPENERLDEPDDIEPEPPVPSPSAVASADPQVVLMLKSIRRVARFMVVLLVLIFLAMLFR